MTSSYTPLASLPVLKDQARRLRASLEAEGRPISHCRALELVAHQYGFRDWNTLHARIGNRPPLTPFNLGAKVTGTYLGQRFTGEVISASAFEADPTRIRLTLRFDEPVDVVTFDSFSSFRHRVNCVVDDTGRSREKTSNGLPHVELAW
ncbi:glyoxalase superfamily protein [Jiella marina]|uniref:glyoxalase superfamily protein n=1 Tax=Jiella sp. LLJ827 TaxID=2917712 RepID=UPI0021018004|nr:glyoxalase superfamily protein [Jiella sp. LLJ827]MCQ0990004.1 glyoxalase superfamily protein [Jiella sp. LLJ827]